MSSSNASMYNHFFHCFTYTTFRFSIAAIAAVKLLFILPVAVVFLQQVHQRWRRQHPSNAVASHSDHFTYHMSAMELIYILGFGLAFCGSNTESLETMQAGLFVVCSTFPGLTFFQVLTCVERYLAVVYPVTYFGLRKGGGVRVRNISIGCVWLLPVAWLGLMFLFYPQLPYMAFYIVLVFSLLLILFCSLSVLYSLVRPRPGEVGGDRDRADQSKQRVLYTITAIMGIQVVSFVGLLFSTLVNSRTSSTSSTSRNQCLVTITGFLVNVPCSLVLPLLFLHRAGKLPGCNYKS